MCLIVLNVCAALCNQLDLDVLTPLSLVVASAVQPRFKQKLQAMFPEAVMLDNKAEMAKACVPVSTNASM